MRILFLVAVLGLTACGTSTATKPALADVKSGAPTAHAHQHIYVITGGNMEHTLEGCLDTSCDRDHVLFDLVPGSGRAVVAGSIVVFHAPAWRVSTGIFVSRVIAVGGQTVKGVTTGAGIKDVVMISDHGVRGPWRTLKEPYVYQDRVDITGTFGPITVPKGRFWVMGDHRNDSADSRYHCAADGLQGTDGPSCNATTSTIPLGDIVGVAVQVVAPQSRVHSL